MKKITALAALTMAGLALATAPAQADGHPKLAETNGALQELSGLPVVAPYAADVRNNMNQVGDHLAS